jgi:hypothetical protein
MGAKAEGADAATGLFFVGHINATGGVIPHPQHRQTRGPTGLGNSGLNELGQLGFYTASKGAAI